MRLSLWCFIVAGCWYSDAFASGEKDFSSRKTFVLRGSSDRNAYDREIIQLLSEGIRRPMQAPLSCKEMLFPIALGMTLLAALYLFVISGRLNLLQ